jgi:hypothetical protein
VRLGHLRIIDESGDDYLYPMDRFVPADLPLATQRDGDGISSFWIGSHADYDKLIS